MIMTPLGKLTQYWSSSSFFCLFRKASSRLIAVWECNLSLVLPLLSSPPYSLLCGSFQHASNSLGSVSHWGTGHGTRDQLFANVDTCQSRLGLFGARQAANWMLPLFSEIKCGLLGSQITGLPLMLWGTEPETERTKEKAGEGGTEEGRGIKSDSLLFAEKEGNNVSSWVRVTSVPHSKIYQQWIHVARLKHTTDFCLNRVLLVQFPHPKYCINAKKKKVH